MQQYSSESSVIWRIQDHLVCCMNVECLNKFVSLLSELFLEVSWLYGCMVGCWVRSKGGSVSQFLSSSAPLLMCTPLQFGLWIWRLCPEAWSLLSWPFATATTV